MLQGDVGSGKTLIAFIAMLLCVERGGQAALMVPTDLLANQHYKNLSELTKNINVNIGLLTGKMKSREKTLSLVQLRSGEVEIIIGTHSLFQKDVLFKDLQLVVVDEQHKFGVNQRQELVNKGNLIDILVMTATPIPRTLQLANFGDMDLSILEDKPARRKIIETHENS